VDAKRTRTHLGASSFRYVFWLVFYLLAIYYQKNSRDEFRTGEAMKDAFARSSFTHPQTGVPMSFDDIRSVGDMWAYVDTKFVPTYYDLFWSNGDPKDEFYKNALLSKNRVTHGMRWTQRRGRINDCTATGKYNSFFPYCYPAISDGGKESIVDFGPYYDETKYKYTYYKHRFSEHEDGFVVTMPYNMSQTIVELQTLKSDRWVDEATQWWRLDFTTYNPSTNLFAQVMLTLDFDTSGQVRPKCEVAIMRSQVYMEQIRDYVQIVLEIIVIIGLLMYLLGNIKDYFHFAYEGAPGDWFLGQFWVGLEVMQLILLLVAFVYWIIIVTDPIRNAIKVELGPAIPGKDGARDIALDSLSYYGGPLSLAPVQVQLRDYFVMQAIIVGLSMFRLLKYLAFNPLFGGIIETFIIIKVQLVQFIIIICSCNVGFAYMANMMFGHELAAFHTFDHAYFSILGMVLGGGVTYAQIAAVNPLGAPVFYVPFTIFYCFIILHMVVALIIESYQVHQAHRVRLVGLWHQVLFGLARNYRFMRRYVGPENQWRFDGPDSEKIRSWLRTWDWDSLDGEEEHTELELFERLREENVTHDDVAFLFKRYGFCTRLRDPPPPEPEVNDMVRELFKQLKVLSDAHSWRNASLMPSLPASTCKEFVSWRSS